MPRRRFTLERSVPRRPGDSSAALSNASRSRRRGPPGETMALCPPEHRAAHARPPELNATKSELELAACASSSACETVSRASASRLADRVAEPTLACAGVAAFGGRTRGAAGEPMSLACSTSTTSRPSTTASATMSVTGSADFCALLVETCGVGRGHTHRWRGVRRADAGDSEGRRILCCERCAKRCAAISGRLRIRAGTHRERGLSFRSTSVTPYVRSRRSRTAGCTRPGQRAATASRPSGR